MCVCVCVCISFSFRLYLKDSPKVNVYLSGEFSGCVCMCVDVGVCVCVCVFCLVEILQEVLAGPQPCPRLASPPPAFATLPMIHPREPPPGYVPRTRGTATASPMSTYPLGL